MLSTFVDTMAQKRNVCLCVYATHDVRTLYTRPHVNTLAAVKLLLLLVVAVCSVMLGADANITDVTQKRLCCKSSDVHWSWASS